MCICISTINTTACNTDVNVFGHIIQVVDRGWVVNHCTKFGINQIIIELVTKDQSIEV